MARYTGPRVRISRRFGVPIFGPTKYLERRNYGPGVHGPKSRHKTTEYGDGLIEKQKLRYYYGLMEKQFRGVYEKALRRRGVTGETMLQILETRLDNVVFQLGFGNTRAAARQLVNHGHVTVNGRKAAIASFALKVNDVISIKNNNVAGRRILSASRKLEGLQPEDRDIRRKKKAGRKAESGDAAAKETRKPRSGRPVTPRAFAAALSGGTLSGPTKTRLLKAVNHLLEQKKQEKVELKALF